MIVAGGYSLIYDKPHNRIMIGLPQTMATATNTVSRVSSRRVDVGDEELICVLNLVELIFGEINDIKDLPSYIRPDWQSEEAKP